MQRVPLEDEPSEAKLGLSFGKSKKKKPLKVHVTFVNPFWPEYRQPADMKAFEAQLAMRAKNAVKPLLQELVPKSEFEPVDFVGVAPDDVPLLVVSMPRPSAGVNAQMQDSSWANYRGKNKVVVLQFRSWFDEGMPPAFQEGPNLKVVNSEQVFFQRSDYYKADYEDAIKSAAPAVAAELAKLAK